MVCHAALDPCSIYKKHIVATSAKLLSSCCCHNFGEKIFRPRSGPHCQSLCASKPLQPPCLHTAQHHPCLLCQLDWSKPYCKCTQVKLGALAAGWSPSCLACACLSTFHALQNFLLAVEHADLVHNAKFSSCCRACRSCAQSTSRIEIFFTPQG